MNSSAISLYRTRGFTTVELGIVLIIFGLIFSTVMGAFSLYNKQITVTGTDTNMSTMQQALYEFQADYGYYPCPADPTLKPSDLNYGKEMRAPVPPGHPVESGLCIGKFPVAGADQDGVPGPDPVFIGSLPFRTMLDLMTDKTSASGGQINTNFSETNTIDGYNNKLLYAVSGNLTNNGPLNIPVYGAINVVDEFGTQLLDPKKLAHFVVVSYGPDGLGAYSRDGTHTACSNGVTLPPGSPNPPPGSSAENYVENCLNNDGTFLSGLSNASQSSLNDDTLKWGFTENSQLWKSLSFTQAVNTNAGNVGIGIDDPKERVHSADDIVANRVDAKVYTDPNNAYTLPPDVLGGDGINGNSPNMKCPAEQVIQNIHNNKADCVTPPVPTYSCPPSTPALYAISTNGTGNCCDPTATGGPTKCP